MCRELLLKWIKLTEKQHHSAIRGENYGAAQWFSVVVKLLGFIYSLESQKLRVAPHALGN